MKPGRKIDFLHPGVLLDNVFNRFVKCRASRAGFLYQSTHSESVLPAIRR